MRNNNKRFLIISILSLAALLMVGCENSGATNEPVGGVDPNETAATVNGTAIKMEAVERAIRQQTQGQQTKLSQLELTQARLQMLDQLIQQEVMFQKAKQEETIPSDEEVTAELNKMKTSFGGSKEMWEKRMKEAGETDETLRETIKKRVAAQKLLDKVAGKVEPPKDSEIEAFYNGNKAAFVRKRGVKLAAIVIDPRDSGQSGDTTKDNESAQLFVQEILKKIQGGADFATLASTESEDASRLRKGDLGYISEEQMKQTFSPQIAAAFMSDQFKIGGVTPAIPIGGKWYIFKLQERIEKEEKLTLESPGVRKQITDTLVDTRKRLLSASYAAVAMDEAKIENFLAKKVVENPNELSGARPASPEATEKSDKSEDAKSEDEKSSDDKSESKDDKSESKDDEKKDEEGAKAANSNTEEKK